MWAPGAPVRTDRARLVAGLALTWAASSALLLLLGRDRPWLYLTGETSPMTWWQSAVLIAAAACALALAYLEHRTRPVQGAWAGRPGRSGAAVWSVLAVAYAVLALDERFALHERLRAGRLLPGDVRQQVRDLIEPGELVVLAVALAGLAVLPWVWRSLRDDRWARTALLVGVALAAVTIGADLLPLADGSAAEHLEQAAEEVVELGSALALLGTVLLRLVTCVERVTGAPAGRPVVHSGEPAGDAPGDGPRPVRPNA